MTAVPETLQCEATSKKTGQRCTAHPLKGTRFCRGHSLSPQEQAEITRAGVEARQVRAAEKAERIKVAHLGLKVMLAERLEQSADEIVTRLEELALSEDDSTALQGLKLWLERVHGRAVQPTQEIAPEIPTELDELRAMTPEELRALMRPVE